jgi:hypothetical protein
VFSTWCTTKTLCHVLISKRMVKTDPHQQREPTAKMHPTTPPLYKNSPHPPNPTPARPLPLPLAAARGSLSPDPTASPSSLSSFMDAIAGRPSPPYEPALRPPRASSATKSIVAAARRPSLDAIMGGPFPPYAPELQPPRASVVSSTPSEATRAPNRVVLPPIQTSIVFALASSLPRARLR